MKKLGAALLAASLFTIGFTAPASAGAAGSIKLKKTQVKNVGPAICGQVNGAWVPGYVKKSTKTTKYFMPHTTQANIYTSQANKVKIKGSAKKKAAATKKKNSLLQQATQYSNMHTQFAESCASGVYQTPLPPGMTYCEKKPLQINLNGAVGVAIKGSNGGMNSSWPTNCMPRTYLPFKPFVVEDSNEIRFATDESNLFAVTTNGAMRQAFNAMVNVRNVLISPTNDVYVVFNGRTNIDDLNSPNWNSGCVIAKANKNDSTLSCIDKSIDWLTFNGGYYSYGNPAIQFLQDGSIFYSGYVNNNSGGMNNYVIRKYQNGVASDVVNGKGNFDINDFSVLPSGDVAVKGNTRGSSSGQPWFRIFWHDGGIDEVINDSGNWSNFMRVLSDGKLYFFAYSWNSGAYSSNNGIYRLDPGTSRNVEPIKFQSNGGSVAPVVNTATECAAESITSGPCSDWEGYNTIYLGARNGFDYFVSNKIIYRLKLDDPSTFEIIRHPLNDGTSYGLSHISMAGSKIIIAGKSQTTQRYKIYAIDLSDGATFASTQYLPISGSNENFDLFHVAYRAHDNQLFVNLMRYIDANVYMANIDLNTGAVTYNPDSNGQVEELLALVD